MQLFYELFPVILFFLSFKLYGIYVATSVGIVATFVQLVMSRLLTKIWDKKQLITFLVFVFFGGMTLYFHDPIFVKWKPTVVFWVFASIILFSQIFAEKPIIQYLMENMIKEKGDVPYKVWRNLNLIWAFFLVVLGAVNLYIAYNYSNEVWVNFKFYGITASLFIISIIQAFYLMNNVSPNNVKK